CNRPSEHSPFSPCGRRGGGGLRPPFLTLRTPTRSVGYGSGGGASSQDLGASGHAKRPPHPPRALLRGSREGARAPRDDGALGTLSRKGRGEERAGSAAGGFGMTSRLGIDVGGTVTDFLLLNERSGEMRLLQTPSTSEDE